MRSATHMIAGAAIGVVLAKKTGLNPGEAICTTGLTVLGAMLPDLDSFTSRLGRILAPASLAIQLVFGHRTILHSPILYITAALAAFHFRPEYEVLYRALLAGVCSHLLLDLLNPAGIPLLFPSRRRFSIPICKSGGLTDYLLTVAFSVLFIWLLAGYIRSLL